MDNTILRILAVVIALLPLIGLRVIIRTANGKYEHTYYHEDGGKYVEKGVKRSVFSYVAFYVYLVVQIGFLIAAYYMWNHETLG